VNAHDDGLALFGGGALRDDGMDKRHLIFPQK